MIGAAITDAKPTRWPGWASPSQLPEGTSHVASDREVQRPNLDMKPLTVRMFTRAPSQLDNALEAVRFILESRHRARPPSALFALGRSRTTAAGFESPGQHRWHHAGARSPSPTAATHGVARPRPMPRARR